MTSLCWNTTVSDRRREPEVHQTKLLVWRQERIHHRGPLHAHCLPRRRQGKAVHQSNRVLEAGRLQLGQEEHGAERLYLNTELVPRYREGRHLRLPEDRQSRGQHDLDLKHDLDLTDRITNSTTLTSNTTLTLPTYSTQQHDLDLADALHSAVGDEKQIKARQLIVSLLTLIAQST